MVNCICDLLISAINYITWIAGVILKGYIDKGSKIFNMASYGITEMPISKGDKLSKEQCPKSELERRNMEGKSYASLVGCLMCAQVCTRPDLAFNISVLGRFQSDAGVAHVNVAKRVLSYLQRTKEHMLISRKTDELVLKGYSYSNFVGCPDDLIFSLLIDREVYIFLIPC